MDLSHWNNSYNFLNWSAYTIPNYKTYEPTKINCFFLSTLPYDFIFIRPKRVGRSNRL